MFSSVQKLVFSVATYYLSHISNKIHTYLFFCQTNRGVEGDCYIIRILRGAEGDQDGGGLIRPLITVLG